MSVPITVRPLSLSLKFSGKKPIRSVFRVSDGDKLRHLSEAVRLFGGTRIVIEADFTPADIRLDGQPRATAKPASHRVAVYAERGDTWYCWRCERFDRWQDNAYAVARTIDALRQSERYGCIHGDEHYSGFMQLPEERDGPDSVSVAIGVLVGFAGFGDERAFRASADTRRTVYRAAAKATHPDTGGSAEDFRRMVRAAEMCEANGLGCGGAA